MTEEIWKPVPEFPEYQVSNFGNFKGLKGIPLKGYVTEAGYKLITFCAKSGSYDRRAHRMVYEAFVGPVKQSIDHIDGNKLNNHIDNLWDCNARENQLSYYRRHTSKLPGAILDKRRKKWKARINIEGKSVHIGSYNTEEEASAAYMKRAAELEGRPIVIPRPKTEGAST